MLECVSFLDLINSSQRFSYIASNADDLHIKLLKGELLSWEEVMTVSLNALDDLEQGIKSLEISMFETIWP